MLTEVRVMKDIDKWTNEERDGVDQPIAQLYESLPKGIKIECNRISANKRLSKLNPFTSISQKSKDSQVLGGPLPFETSIIAEGLKKLNRRESKSLALSSLRINGPFKSISYLFSKMSRHNGKLL